MMEQVASYMHNYQFFYRFLFVAVVALGIHPAPTNVAFAQNLVYPHVTTQTNFSQQMILPGESVSVHVRVSGSTKVQDTPIPAGIVFVLDYSGSMSRNIDTLRTATAHLIDQLDTSRHQVAAVAFATDVTLLSELTSDFSSVRSAIDQHSIGGFTNIAGGFVKATEQLRNTQLPLRFGILFTDGRPEPRETASQQSNVIHNELNKIAREPITFHTIGLGDVDSLLLDTLARRTGGTFTAITNASDLQTVFDKIYQTNSTTLTTRAIQIKESLSSRLNVNDGSFLSSYVAPSIDPESFQNELKNEVQSFYQISELQFPIIGEIGALSFFAYSFDVSVDRCDETQDVIIPLRSPQSSITYSNGDIEEQVVGFDNARITIRKCGVYIDKIWHETERKVSIVIHNALGRPIRDVFINEILCREFDVDWTRKEEFAPFPTDYNPSSPRWNLGTIAHGQKMVVSFPIKETNKAHQGRNPIQCNDYWTTWEFEEPAFKVLKSEGIYPVFRRELNPSMTLSVDVLDYISGKLGHNTNFSAATVNIAPKGMSDQGYLWKIKVDGLEKIPVPPPTPRLNAEHESRTGLLYVKEIDDGFEIVSGLRHQEVLPELYTSPDFVPSP